MNDEKIIIPIFPLSLVAFPSVGLNLHIFEPRYRELVRDVYESNGTFGIPPVINQQIQNVGTEMKILSIEKYYEDGKMDIKTGGIGRFRLETYYEDFPNKMYSAAEVRRLDADFNGLNIHYQDILSQLEHLFKLFRIEKQLPQNDGSLISYGLATLSGMNIQQEYELLLIDSEEERLENIRQHLLSFLPQALEIEEMRKKIQMNGHFRDLTNPL